MNSFNLCCALLAIFGTNLIVNSLPVYDPSTGQLYHNISTLEDIPGYNASNGTEKELYVIKAVVYEIGILTEVSENSTDYDDYDQTHEQIDLSFYNGKSTSNGSKIDFGDIPLPIQQQINGQVITGIAPVHIGEVENAEDILQTLPLTGTVFNITDSQNAVINFSRHNATEESAPTIVHGLNFNNVPVEISNAVLPSVDVAEEVEEEEAVDVTTTTTADSEN